MWHRVTISVTPLLEIPAHPFSSSTLSSGHFRAIVLSPLSVSFVHPFRWIRSTVRHKVGESRHKSLKRVLRPRSTWMRPPLRVTEVHSWGSHTKKYQRRQTLALTHNSLLERNEKILRMRVSGSLSKGDGRFGSFLPWNEIKRIVSDYLYKNICLPCFAIRA